MLEMLSSALPMKSVMIEPVLPHYLSSYDVTGPQCVHLMWPSDITDLGMKHNSGQNYPSIQSSSIPQYQ